MKSKYESYLNKVEWNNPRQVFIIGIMIVALVFIIGTLLVYLAKILIFAFGGYMVYLFFKSRRENEKM